MPSITTRGINVHYEDAGRGAPMVLLGGTLGTARGDFSPQIEAFAPSYRVVAPDRRGYGKTRPPARDYPDDFYQRDADDMAAFTHALGLEPITLLGWSEGANVALCLAALYPEKVLRVVVWGGLAAVDEVDIAIFEARRDVTIWPAKARDAMTANYGESYWPDTWHQWCDVMTRLCARGGDVGLARLENIACPVMVVHGCKDVLIRAVHPTTIHHRIAGSVLHEIEDGGHNLHLTHAIEFNRLALEFAGRAVAGI